MAVIAKYKFNSTLYADLVPEFNAEFTNYVVTDEATETDSEGNVIKTRVIEHDTLLPTFMRFGRIKIEGETTTDVRTDSLLEVLDMNTSELTNCYSMFRYNTNLTSISCEWNTSNVTSMSSMFYNCNNLTSLDVSNFNTSNVTSMSSMFCMCKSLTSLDVSNFDTSNVTNMYSMFRECNKLTLLDVSNFDTSNVTTMYCLFDNCKLLTSIDVSNFDTSNVTTMYGMFAECKSLTSLDVSNFDTSNVTTMFWMFGGCKNLTSLDVSNFDTKNVTNMFAMFYYCNKLTSLDVSNFNISKVTNMDDIFSNTPLLKDIGMLYCSQSTINALSSVISTPSTNVWVEGSMIDGLTSYDNVTYKAYYWEKEVLLNSPLLEGDKIVKKDGKMYHYHKMGMIVLDGSEEWYGSDSYDTTQPRYWIIHSFGAGEKAKNSNDVIFQQISDKMLVANPYNAEYTKDCCCILADSVRIRKNEFVGNPEGFKQWLSKNPTTIVYELANPYYELISDTSDDLSLSLLSENNIISNNSLIPTNMNVKNNGMSTVAMQSSTKYTVAFDKDTDSSVTIDLCGSTIDTTDNVVEITTPSELANDEITFIGDCEVSNVRILEGSVSGDVIPRESFEGLKNSFEDGKIEGFSRSRLITGYISGATNENMNLGDYISGDNYNRIFIFDAVVGENITVTQPESTRINIVSYAEYPQANTPSITCFIDVATKNVEYTVPEGSKYVCVQLWRNNDKFNGTVVDTNNDSQLIDEAINTYTIKGDKSIGKYKVEYKVTGKNKVTLQEEGVYYIFESGLKVSSTSHDSYIGLVEPSKTYIISFENVERGKISNLCFWDSSMKFIKGIPFHSNDLTFTTPHNTKFITIAVSKQAIAFQIEEGIVATEYEPYKEYTKTFYLNSPLLEGDTIEDVNGVATHVKRMGKVVLDGSEGWIRDGNFESEDTMTFARASVDHQMNESAVGECYCDRFRYLKYDGGYRKEENFGVENINTGGGYRRIYLRILKSKLETQDVVGLQQWLQANPTTVVYKLASPIYEPISTESILCDSYVNGHLDVDSNIPIEKVEFRNINIRTRYLQPNTRYCVQFYSDNTGVIYKRGYFLGSGNPGLMNDIAVHKGNNRFNLGTGGGTLGSGLSVQGIGFNASNIQVVATERDNIGYFKGIQSSFEDKITEDNKYEVKVTLEDENGVISNEFIYLNSPLLKGDRIEMYNGKLCHYHKMGKVVFDGSEDENWILINNSSEYDNYFGIKKPLDSISYDKKILCNNFRMTKNANTTIGIDNIYIGGSNINICKVSHNNDIVNFKQWLSENPTTVVYELAEPYYEDITPIQNEFVITSIGESSFTIDSGAIPTDGEITYSVNVKLLNDLEESINNNTSTTDTDLSTILDDIINE